MKRIKKAPRAKRAARAIGSKNATPAVSTHLSSTHLKRVTSARAIVLGMTFVIVTAVLLTAGEDLPAAAVERPDLSPLAATVQNNIALPSEAKEIVAPKKKPAAVQTAPATPSVPVAASTNLIVAPQAESSPSVTITGCLDNQDGAFRLTDASGADAPTARSWKSGFLKKRSAQIEVVDAAGTLNLRHYAGRRVGVTGTLVDRDMRARSVRLIGPCD